MENSNQTLKGKVAIVTGASKNLGAETATYLGSSGTNVIVHHFSDGSKSEALQIVEKIKASGNNAKLVQADLRQVSEIKRLFDEAESTFGKVDILVNTAGTMLKKPAAEVLEDEYDQMFNIHTKSAFFLLSEAAKRVNDGGRIVNISTTLTSVTTGLYSVYAGAKAASEQFVKMIAKEIGSRGVTVNSIAPGPLNTSFFYPVENEHSIDYLKHMSVQNRLGEISDVLPMVKFLTSPEAGWVTAQSIRVNGGMF
ncbi:SDR family oxidoreductase [uncultured Aquimarina sp.]|uniref:SDR family oxidoreductase n=1 Tax=uncultured Aquimarina sp. TaxID=575652 RepID=UPI002616E0B5|nr:SDR family oxidoreductase [uncultured Aquimarina sp.]